jgi:hypothetical protein
VQDWQEYAFSFSAPLPAIILFDGLDETGIRLTRLTFELNGVRSAIPLKVKFMRQQSKFLRQATLWLLLPIFRPLPVQASQSTNQQVSQPAESDTRCDKGQLEQLHIRNVILQAEVQGRNCSAS